MDAEIPSWLAEGGEGPGRGEEGPGDVRRFLEGGEDISSEFLRGEGEGKREESKWTRLACLSTLKILSPKSENLH